MSNRVYADGILISGTGSPGNRVYADGILMGGVPVATITHNKNGTISITLIGTNGAKIYCNPGNGNPIEEKTLLGPGVNVFFSYANDGTTRNISLTGDLGELTTLAAPVQNILALSDMPTLTKLNQFSFYSNPSLSYFPCVGSSVLNYINFRSCGISSPDNFTSLYGMNLFYINNNAMTYPPGGLTWFTATSGTYRFYSTVTTSGEVDQWLIDLATANWSGTNTYLDGTNPARTSASDAAVAQLVLDGNVLHLN